MVYTAKEENIQGALVLSIMFYSFKIQRSSEANIIVIYKELLLSGDIIKKDMETLHKMISKPETLTGQEAFQISYVPPGDFNMPFGRGGKFSVALTVHWQYLTLLH